MPADFSMLLRRDHADVRAELALLLQPGAPAHELRGALDGVRLGLIAHAEAEDIVLAPFEAVPELQALIARARAAHLAQEGALSALVCARPGSVAWRHYAIHLGELVAGHEVDEAEHLLPALRAHPAYATLAARFATMRLRQLSMLQPSTQMMAC
jgi:hypothetical protein